jgi:hypothetical protein
MLVLLGRVEGGQFENILEDDWYSELCYEPTDILDENKLSTKSQNQIPFFIL